MHPTRRIIQAGFLLLTIGGVFVYRGNAERWCPFGGVEALYTYAIEGDMLCSLGTSNFFILGGVILMTLLLRRAFCGYMCPIGTTSEWLQKGAARVGVRAWRVPPGLDRALSLLKYPILGVILYFTYRTAELVFRGFDPCYALLSRHGEDITIWAYVVVAAIVLGSLLVVIPFCRWLCPLAAVLNVFSRFGFTRIRRHEEACVGCGKCAKACPMAIPVHELEEVKAARCISCMECVDACPPSASGAIDWGPPRRRGRGWPAWTAVVLLLACTTAAVAASYLFPMPSFVKTRGEAPPQVATTPLAVHNLTCRGKATLLMYFLERDDDFELPGYLKVEAWPGPGAAKLNVTFDPAKTDEAAIRRAVTEPYHDAVEHIWRFSPFEIEGYDPFGTEDDSVPAG